MTSANEVSDLGTEAGCNRARRANKLPPPPIPVSVASEPPEGRSEQDAIDIAAVALALLRCNFHDTSALAVVSRVPYPRARLLIQLLEEHYRHSEDVLIAAPYEIRNTGNAARREVRWVLRAAVAHYRSQRQQVVFPIVGIQHVRSHEAITRDISSINLGNVSLVILATTSGHEPKDAADNLSDARDHGDCALTSSHSASHIRHRRAVHLSDERADERTERFEKTMQLAHNGSVRTNLFMTWGRYLESDGLRLARAVIKERFGSTHWPEMAAGSVHHFARGSTLRLKAYADLVYSYLGARDHGYRGFCRETIEHLVRINTAANGAKHALPRGYASIAQSTDLRWEEFLWTRYRPTDDSGDRVERENLQR